MSGERPLPSITLDDMISEVRRECGYRRYVYGRAVKERRMNSRAADRRIDVMDAVLNFLEAQQNEPDPELELESPTARAPSAD